MTSAIEAEVDALYDGEAAVAMVVHAAGLYEGTLVRRQSVDVVDRVLAANLRSAYLVASKALPLMSAGGRIVFITSHQAHFHGRIPVPDDYRPVAVSKRAGEDALLAMRPVFDTKGIALVVVSGDMIDGTTTVRLLERSDPDAVAARRAVAPLATVSEFASAIVRATQEHAQDNQTIYVGGPDYLR